MTKHYIIMGSSYKMGKRIAMDFTNYDTEYLKAVMKKIRSKCGRVPLSSHSISTESSEWCSVVELDAYFENVLIIETVDEFIDIIKEDSKLISTDISSYILAKTNQKYTQMHIYKLVYLCFADYLCEYKKRLFFDEIYAFKLGPIPNGTYQKYKFYGRSVINKVNSLELARSRILTLEDGVEKISSIDKTLKKYEQFSANELSNITHREKSPWSEIYEPHQNFIEIPVELIYTNHKYEEI